MKKVFFYLALPALASSCAPAVRAAVLKSYPAVVPDSVVVYSKSHEVPATSEALGSVRVYDGGFTTQCDSLTVVNHVKLEVGKIGGNAALITEHKLPSFWTSTCHQMTATALRVNGLNTPMLDSAAVGQLLLKPARTQPRARFAANIGYGWRLAKISPSLTADARKDLEQRMSGMVWEFSAAYFFNDAMGIGVDYNGYGSTSNSQGYLTNAPHITGSMHTSDMITYIGPAWVFRSAYGKWILEGSMGIGYVGFTEKMTLRQYSGDAKGSTVGMKFSLGADYKLHENLA
ncbi:MAG: hypothetical protein LBU92_06065, partial [Prevotellaceae bacterium]|nr:hypothetical protein [Prevotellaceae bacterium]